MTIFSADNKVYSILGLMSGSSLDGLDIAACRIQLAPKPLFTIEAAATYPYTNEQVRTLQQIAALQSADDTTGLKQVLMCIS